MEITKFINFLFCEYADSLIPCQANTNIIESFIHMIRRLLTLLIVAFFIGCSTSRQLNHPTTSATLWMQNAAEYDALTTLVYRTAANNLDLAYEDSYWTALPQQANSDEKEYIELPPAVVVDVDETVLDNSPFQARMIKQGKSYNIEDWNRWVREAQADAIPGALEFTQYAAQKGITVFYLTNREHRVEEPTRQNLRDLGFPLSDSLDVILTQKERESWTSAKVNRRAYLADRFRVLMLFGDDLNDFVPAKDISQQQRDALVESYKQKWGSKWFILPNPGYGSWEQALYNFDNSLSDKKQQESIKNKLNTKN